MAHSGYGAVIAPPLLVGVDVGTTRTKASVIDGDGRELTSGSVATIWRSCPTGADARPADLLDGSRRAIAAALAGAPAGEIAAVGVTSMAETAILLGDDGAPMGRATAWHDRRGAADLAAMREALTPAEVQRRTGLHGDPAPTVATLRSMIAVDPALRGATSALSVAEWIVYGLGGMIAAEPSLASRTGALDISARGWWAEGIAWAGLAPALFPPLRTAGTSWGRLTDSAPGLERLAGATLTVAGHDHVVAAIGSGVTAAGQVMNSLGTAEALLRAVPADRGRDPGAGFTDGIDTGWHALPDHQCLLAGLSLGIELTPLLRELGAVHEHGRTSLDAAALACLDGELDEALLAGAERRWLHAVRAAVGRSAATLRELERLGGPVDEVRLSGGWAANPVLRRCKLRAFANTLCPDVAEAGARGAALLGGQAAGVFHSSADFPPPSLTGGLASAAAEPRSLPSTKAV